MSGLVEVSPSLSQMRCNEAQRGQCLAQGHTARDEAGRCAEPIGCSRSVLHRSALWSLNGPSGQRCPPGGGISEAHPLQGPLRATRDSELRPWRLCGQRAAPLGIQCPTRHSQPQPGGSAREQPPRLRDSDGPCVTFLGPGEICMWHRPSTPAPRGPRPGLEERTLGGGCGQPQSPLLSPLL